MLDPEAEALDTEGEASIEPVALAPLALAAPPAIQEALSSAADTIGPPPSESPRKPLQSHFRHPSAPSPSSTPGKPRALNHNTALLSSAPITSPFQLTSPRQFVTPPSPRTVRMPDQGYIPDPLPVQDEETGEPADEQDGPKTIP